MRRTLGYFMAQKFEQESVRQKLKSYGFEPGNHTRVIVTWEGTPEAFSQAKEKEVAIWRFPDLLREIAQKLESNSSYFVDDTVRTIGLFIRSEPDRRAAPMASTRHGRA